MFDEYQDNGARFDFEDFRNHLLDQGLSASPSQLHGCLSGLLCAGASAEPECGLDALGRALELELHGELAGLVMDLYSATATALRDEDFSFTPLLPDDEADVETRTAALAGWCDGFVTGFAHCIADDGQPREALSLETGEILKDIADMAQAEPGDEADEELEHSFSELVEYLRVAVVNVYLNVPVTSPEPGAAPDAGRSVH